jgi:hypothetical protein
MTYRKDEAMHTTFLGTTLRCGALALLLIARALVAKGEMTVWQYGVRRGPNDALQQAPTQKLGLLAHSSLRVEPYTTPYTIIAHE